MIARIEGKLVELGQETALVQVGALCYEVLLPGYAVSELGGSLGKDVTLCTMEYYEGTLGGGNLVPRIIGFLTPGEKKFFGRYTSVKGMGIRKGLKSLAVPIATIAEAIESGEEKLLQSLPGVGKRMAQLIVAELRGKLQEYAIGAAATAADGKTEKFDRFQIEALEVLIAWGEKRAEAMELITLASRRHPEIKTAEELVPLAYRIKQGVEA